MKEENDLSDLMSLWEEGVKVRMTKYESPIGTILHRSHKKKGKVSKKRTYSRFTLSKPIVVGQAIIKKGTRKEEKMKRETEFYATLSSVKKIQKNAKENYYIITTKNSKYIARIQK